MAGGLDLSWISDKPLVFAHVVLTKMLSFLRAKEIRDRITKKMDLWKRGLYAGLVGGDEAEGDARECRVAIGGEEEHEAVARSYHDTVMLGEIRQAVRRVTSREGGG